MKITFFKKKDGFKKKSLEIDADFYWKIILYTTIFCIVLASVYGFYLFSVVNKEIDPSAAASLGEKGTVKKERLDKAIEIFSQKENASKNIMSSPSPVVDPSL